VLQGRRSKVGVDDMARLVVRLGDPFGKLERVGDGGGEEDVVDRMGKEDDGLLPDDSSFCFAKAAGTKSQGPSSRERCREIENEPLSRM
jgi:hypothetical protein